MVIGYCLCKYRNIRLTPHREVKHLFWFYVRHFGNYFCVILNLTVLSYFRLSTSRVFFLLSAYSSNIFIYYNFKRKILYKICHRNNNMLHGFCSNNFK